MMASVNSNHKTVSYSNPSTIKQKKHTARTINSVITTFARIAPTKNPSSRLNSELQLRQWWRIWKGRSTIDDWPHEGHWSRTQRTASSRSFSQFGFTTNPWSPALGIWSFGLWSVGFLLGPSHHTRIKTKDRRPKAHGNLPMSSIPTPFGMNRCIVFVENSAYIRGFRTACRLPTGVM